MKMSIKIKGLNKLERKLNTISKNLPVAVSNGVKEAIEKTCKYALHLKRGRDEGILFEMVDTDSKSIKGRVYTDVNKFPWAWFEHYGTGQYAQLPHIGTSKHFIESGYEEWFIPVGKVKESLNYPIIMIKGIQFYVAHGVRPNPFLQKAEFERRNDNLDVIQDKIYEMLKEVCK